MNRKVLLIFLAVFLIAAFLRLYLINSIPPGVNRDEASIGYTAYSLLKTGNDEYGRHLPISIQSFGDWKLPLYVYTVVPMVKLFGLSEFAVRLPSALFGIFSVVLTFFLIRSLFKNNLLALITMFLTAISPWHLHLSRVESESNTAVFLVILAVILFLESLKGKQWFIIPSAIFFALTYFTYAGNHVFTTLLILGLILIYRSEIKINKVTIVAAIIFFAMSGLIFYQTLLGADKTKLSGISIFGDPSVVHARIELPRNEHSSPNSFLARITHNKVIFSFERFGQNYLNSYSPQFLFIKGGDNKAHNISNFGNMYLIEAPFLFLGLIYLITQKKGREKKLILWWFFIAPLVVSITKDAPHTNRMFAIFPVLPLVVAAGLYWTVENLIKKEWRKVFIFIIAFLFIVSVTLYIDRYYVHFPRNEEMNWGLGYKKLEDFLSKPSNSSKKIIMSRPQYSPYIYILFYSKYDPYLYQKTAVRYLPTDDGFVDVKKFGKYEFRTIDWGKDIQTPNVLLVDWSDQIPLSIKEAFHTQDIILSNSGSMFTIVETK